jgi:long-chain acyl-CoA synthetase
VGTVIPFIRKARARYATQNADIRNAEILRPLTDIFVPSEKLAFVNNKDCWTRERLVREADRLAAGFVRIGVRSGDRVALHLHNGPAIVIAYLACLRLGAIAAPLHPHLELAKLDATLQRLRPTIYIGHADLYRLIAPFAGLTAAARYVVGEPEDGIAQSWTLLQQDSPAANFNALDPNALAVLLSTSGTTGQPKLVAHSRATLACALSRMKTLPVVAGDVYAFVLPLAHMTGLITFFSGLLAGASLVMLDANDPDSILDAIEMRRCTYLISPTAMIASLMQRQRIHPRNVSSLRFCLVVGDVCLLGQQEEFPYLFGLPLRNCWTSTEAISSFTYGLQAGPVSRPAAGIGIKLVDADGRSVTPGAPGEMLLRGPHVAVGYWAGPDELEPFADGWHRTGDIMREDEEGNFWFVARGKAPKFRSRSNVHSGKAGHALANYSDASATR